MRSDVCKSPIGSVLTDLSGSGILAATNVTLLANGRYNALASQVDSCNNTYICYVQLQK